MKSKLMFKDDKGALRTLDFHSNTDNLKSVQDQATVQQIIKNEVGITVKSKTPVLCLLYGLAKAA